MKSTVAIQLSPIECEVVDIVAATLRQKTNPTKPATRAAAIRELMKMGYIVFNDPYLYRLYREGKLTKENKDDARNHSEPKGIDSSLI